MQSLVSFFLRILFNKKKKIINIKFSSKLDALKNLKQQILWKFEDDSLPDIPSNIMIRKWLPQNDILAHKNVVLFISHGGLFGTSESLYHGVPLLLVPIFGDQFRNAYRVKRSGYGNYIYYNDISEESFTKGIIDMISNEGYMIKAKETSAIFKDNLVHPMQESMFWIEHVAKFKGAKHLKSHAVNMSWFSYLIFDVLFVSAIIALIGLFLLYWIVSFLFTRKATEKKDKRV